MPPKKAVARAGAPSQDHITTIGVRRPGFGGAGRLIRISTNHFVAEIPDGIITHYDVVILPADKTKTAPDVFVKRAVYDGRKNLFASEALSFGQMKEFEVALEDPNSRPNGRPPKLYKVRLNKVAEINPEILARFLQGKQSHDNSVLTAITALNVVIRMEPNIKWPFNVRSFFTDRETKPIGGGLELWRGYFQSARPALNRMLINIDISTGVMFKPGPLIGLCLDFFETKSINVLMPLKERDRVRLQRFLKNIRVATEAGGITSVRSVTEINSKGASGITFLLQNNGKKTVQGYFKEKYNVTLKYPEMACVQLGRNVIVPMELCTVPSGQIMRRQVPPEKTKSVLEFATKKPADRLNSIRNGLEVLSYGQSEYLRAFGISVSGGKGPLTLEARVLTAPLLRYGAGSKQPTIQPREGAWNMIDKKLYNPCTIQGWAVIVFERPQRFPPAACDTMVQELAKSCASVGIKMLTTKPLIQYPNGQGDVATELRRVGGMYKAKMGVLPQLLVIVLPEGGDDIYRAIKHFGDIQAGVATQCLKSSKCLGAKPQYFANVCLKINVKLGGVNAVPESRSIPFLSDASNPTIVMGADVGHPSPGTEGFPSFTSLVCNVDSDNSKYNAAIRAQKGRQEMIDDLEDMACEVFAKYMANRSPADKKPRQTPKRIIFYRDGVSEGQFRTVLETEVPRLRAACAKLKMSPIPKITMVIVGKRHHVRFFPQGADADRSGNCPAGTTVDSEITHPTDFDFYLQSHGGLLGTSRPAHYSVLLDENNFQADSFQQLSNALCYVFARATRSVSIPAPVYHADLVCSTANRHYDPNGQLRFSEDTSLTSGQATEADNRLETYQSNFKPNHKQIESSMFWM